ncbi:MAG: phage tail tape measure protein, partial [Bacteroidota bacterium]|nr:phage tail tape measure protein [Bacteroidota bacterium]
QVTQAILQAGVAAKGANVSFEQTNALIQVLAKGGKLGSEAGVALRNVLGLIQKASGPAAEAMQKMGTSTEELGRLLTTEGPEVALEKLRAGLESLNTDAERNAALMTIFGQENANAAGVLLDNLPAYYEFYEGIQQGQEGLGSAFEQAAQNMDNAQGKIDRAMAWIEDKAITVFNAFGSSISAAMITLTQVGPQLTALAGLKNIIPPSAVGNVSKFATSLLSTLVPSLFTTNAATGAVTFSFSAMWTAITGPVGIVVAAIAAVAAALYLIYDNVEPVRNAVDSFIEFVAPAFEKIWEVIKMVGEVLWEVGKLLYEYFITPWQIAFELIMAILEPIWDVVSAFFASGEAAAGAGAAMDIFNKAIGFVQRALLTVKGTIRGSIFALRAIKDVIIDVFGALSRMSLKDIIMGIATGDFGELGEVFSSAGEKIGTAFDEGWNDAVKLDVPEPESGGGGGSPTQPTAKLPVTPTLDPTAGEKIRKIRVEVEKLLAESEERLAERRFAAAQRASERELDETIRAQETVTDNMLLSSTERMAAWLDLERERHAKAMEIATRALEEEQRSALDSVDEKIAAVQAKEEYSEAQKAALIAAYQEERTRIEVEYAERTAEAVEDLARESEERKTEFVRAEDEKRIEILKARQERENRILENALARQLKIERRTYEVFEQIAVDAATRTSDRRLEDLERQKERELDLVGDSEAAKAEVERFYAAERAKIEEQLANRRAAASALRAGSDLFGATSVDIASLEKARRDLEAQLALTPPESEAAADLRRQLEDVEATLAEKRDTIGVLTEALEADFAAGMAGMFSGNTEAMKDGMRQTLGTIAGFLQQLATSAVMEIVLSSPTIKGLAAAAGPLAPVVIAGIAATIRGGINALLSPILNQILSFATGGRVDEPTLAVVGDAARLTGSNTEWILRDQDIREIVTLATEPIATNIVREIRQLTEEVRILQREQTLVRGTDIVRVYSRDTSRRSRRIRT